MFHQPVLVKQGPQKNTTKNPGVVESKIPTKSALVKKLKNIHFYITNQINHSKIRTWRGMLGCKFPEN